MGVYEEFENICFVDTLDNTSFAGKQLDLFAMSVENTARIKRQNDRTISVIIGNPPYNAKQENFNDNNANRYYTAIDKLIKESYIKYSKAQNKNILYDMYVRFYRWATDRVKNGIICFITNSSFLDGRAFDGFRKSIQDDFSFVYVIDLGGNVRSISGKDGIFIGEKHTIFGESAMTGIVICFLIKDSNSQGCKIFYSHPFHIHELRENKIRYLAENKFDKIAFDHIKPDQKFNWINQSDNDFETLLPLVDKDVKAGKGEESVFKLFSRGVETTRDEWVYDFNQLVLMEKIKNMIEIYNLSIENKNMDNYIKWSSSLESYFNNGIKAIFNQDLIKLSLYRPYFKLYHYTEKLFNHRLTQNHYEMFSETLNYENKIISFSGIGSNKYFHCLSSNLLIGLDTIEKTQCLPLYRYDKEGKRIDNITDWGLKQIQTHYQDETITKIDIFHYTYAVLHNPAYRTKYELNLKREFPRLPYYENFQKWVNWGKQLMELHINYETVTPYNLTRLDIPLKDNQKTPKPKLKADKTKNSIILDDVTTLENIPKIAWEYMLGNRCALEWILDQYKEKKPKDPTIAEKFNTYRFADYKEQVIDLLMRVCTVSVETMNIIREME
jgi:predicted helicase